MNLRVSVLSVVEKRKEYPHEAVEPPRVITAYFDRNMRDKL